MRTDGSVPCQLCHAAVPASLLLFSQESVVCGCGWSIVDGGAEYNFARNISLLFVDLLRTRNSDISLKMFSVIAALTGKYMVGQFDSSFSLGTLVDSMDFISVFAQARLNVEGTRTNFTSKLTH